VKINRLIITEEERNEIRSLYSLINEQPVVPPVPTIIKVSDEDSLVMDSTDAKGFLSKFVKDILTNIDNDPQAKNTMNNGQMEILSLIVRGGASNVWDGKPTGYDFENDRKTAGTKTETDLYQKNKDLAAVRSDQFKNKLIAELSKYNIKVSPNVKIKTDAYVYNTGGVNDASRDTTKYPNNGQFLSATIQLSYLNTPFNISTITQVGVPGIPKGFVMTGSYFCDGKNSRNESAREDTYVKQCQSLPTNLKNGEHISAWELKWAPKVVDNPDVIPVVRWNFFWNSGGTIDRVSRVLFNKPYKGKETFDKLIPSSNSVGVDDVMLKSMMGLPEGDTNGGTTYVKYIAPFK
jgi:hypothetical protein